MQSKQVFLSPRNYIIQKAKSLPIIECLVDINFKKLGITNVVVVRQEPGGKYTIGVFCVDLYCLGIKNAFCDCHIDDEDREKITNAFESGSMQVSATFAHNLIYGAIDYASEMGFEPHKDFALAEKILDESLIDDGIDEIEFGLNGRPYYCQGPNDNTNKILAQLNKYVGEGNYKFLGAGDDFLEL